MTGVTARSVEDLDGQRDATRRLSPSGRNSSSVFDDRSRKDRGESGTHELAMVVDGFVPGEPTHEFQRHGGVESAPQELGLPVDVTGANRLLGLTGTQEVAGWA